MTRRGVALGITGLLVITGGYFAARSGLGTPLPDTESCTASVNDYTVAMSTEQAENASLMAAVAERRGLPARAVSIAIAVAYQESKLVNINYGDRDSVGLFQQRPSQGWGTANHIMNPYYAINAFYDALVKVDGYQDMEITKAAQAVQRSAFPDAYADHEKDGRTIASAMSGNSEAAFSCVVSRHDEADEQAGADGLTPRAEAVREDMAKAFGDLALGGFEPGGVTNGHTTGSAHYEGRAIDVFYRPVNADNSRRGWVLAHYLVANADRLHIDHVIFGDLVWTAGSLSEDGWRGYTPPGLTGNESAKRLAILEHRDHVHVDVP